MANDGKNEGNSNFIQPSIPRFDGHYDHWSMLMENFLRSKEFWSLVETGYVEPEAGAAVTEAQRKRLEELKLKDLKVKNYLFQAIDRFKGRGRGGSGFRGGGRGRGCQAFDKTTVECYRCHKLGHFQYECPTLNKEANYAELDEEEEILLMSHVELHEARREDAWFLDSGCSNHMCGDKTMFCELNEGFRQLVKLGNNTRMTVLGKGEEKSGIDEDEANGSEGNETSENDTEGSGIASSNTTSEDDVNPNERREIHAPV
ncbi:hypothetical protein LWI29_009824 [Acer saccharum]|uniref:CCHC-type domain-containing protein n=1 Tax=Acer saccharum TaxID=4024 RepID=A0AA39T4J7_ACESA|nr:hypothetical protein LWI29_009824 [Acer saccharum]